MSCLRSVAALVVTALAAVLPPTASAQDDAPRKALKVCQDPNNLPFSNTAGEGIENKLAELFGKALGLPVQYYEFPQRMAFVRNTLRFKLPGEDYRCDLMMGVPVGFDQVSVTKPYYRSTYALVIPLGKGLDGVKSTADFLALGKDRLGKLRIGVFDRSPASDWLARHDLTDQGVPYKMLDADPARYPGQIIEDELAQGRIDAAIVWGPLAGFFAQRVKQPQLVVIPMASEPGVRFDYQMAMGVRYGEKAWKDQIEALIDARRPDIRAILQSYNVPLLEDAPAPSR
ncbi:substrate-binding domain-containing protein [Ideonella sp. 4Y16]|uniref:Substrate-binding domain-containing protein n=1 Tax=Ideonella alba TaxID=2824118 RepID=A0A941BBB8_9BURK|nr:substrate-binding domain-containing protein [Ideonella alba]MBQ0930705.1 substrate-binding domain-containing protein [Ideonella alba]MBQ0944820.1 substrate-binding domain-containing protein [Ideonella alba]